MVKIEPKRIRVCMLTFDFPPTPGGIANHVYELSKALVKKGVEVHVVVPSWLRKEKMRDVVDGINVHRVHANAWLKHRNPFLTLKLAHKLNQVIRKYGIQVVHNHSYFYGTFVMWFSRRERTLLTNHEGGFLEFFESRLLRRVLHLLLKRYDFVIAPSEELRVKAEWCGFPAEKTLFITNGVDDKRFSPEVAGNEIRMKYGINETEILVLCPRRLEPKNGVEFFVKAAPLVFQKNPSIKFMVVGGGFPNERKRFEEFIAQEGLEKKVLFTGNIDNKEMPAFYAASDMVILPSLMEATSLSGLEAMATGKPLIGTRVGGIPFLIDDGVTGILIPSANTRAICNAILKLSEDESLMRKLGTAGRRKVEEKLSWDKIAHSTLAVYSNVLKMKKG